MKNTNLFLFARFTVCHCSGEKVIQITKYHQMSSQGTDSVPWICRHLRKGITNISRLCKIVLSLFNQYVCHGILCKIKGGWHSFLKRKYLFNRSMLQYCIFCYYVNLVLHEPMTYQSHHQIKNFNCTFVEKRVFLELCTSLHSKSR